jgi:hypothetical protein
MAKLFNRARMTVFGTPGTGTITLGGAFSNSYCTFAEAGIADTNVVAYFVEDGTDFEIGIGTYTAAGTTLSRDTVRLSKIAGTSGTTKLTLTSAAIVYLSPGKEDILSISETQTANRLLAGPVSGGAVVPAFRQLTAADMENQTANKVYAGPTTGGAAAPTFRSIVAADLPSTAVILQVLSTTYSTYTNLNVAIPSDDTLPQSTEGVQVLSQAITMANSTNKVLAFVHIWGGNNVSSFIIAALFRGTTCIKASSVGSTTATEIPEELSMIYLDSPGASGVQTYSVRVGPEAVAANTCVLNGDLTTHLFGTAGMSTLTLMEIAA